MTNWNKPRTNAGDYFLYQTSANTALVRGKSAIYGGIYASSLHAEHRKDGEIRPNYDFRRTVEKLKNIQDAIAQVREKTRTLSLSIKNNLKSHISHKQEVYWPVFVAMILLLFVFASKITFAEMDSAPNNLPVENKSKLNIIGFHKYAVQPNVIAVEEKNGENNREKDDLKNKIAGIVKNTPMAAMIESISERDRTVAAFIVGIAMKESKFGVYSPRIGGRDCFNYWGFKGGGKTVSGGYTCFHSPEDAVEAVGKRLEKMVAKGVKNPAQAISWKCGSSCAGHDPGGVHKWIADVGVNFYKINS